MQWNWRLRHQAAALAAVALMRVTQAVSTQIPYGRLASLPPSSVGALGQVGAISNLGQRIYREDGHNYACSFVLGWCLCDTQLTASVSCGMVPTLLPVQDAGEHRAERNVPG